MVSNSAQRFSQTSMHSNNWIQRELNVYPLGVTRNDDISQLQLPQLFTKINFITTNTETDDTLTSTNQFFDLYHQSSDKKIVDSNVHGAVSENDIMSIARDHPYEAQVDSLQT